MLKFWHHNYTLQPLTQIGTVASNSERHGALLKIQWPDGKIGYADLHPWPELGDSDLETQLLALARGRISPLVEQAIWLAKRDAVLRKDGKSAFQGLGRVKNHFLINDPTRVEDVTLTDLKSAGFTTVKIKVGRNLEQEAKLVDRLLKQHHQLWIRLDFNSSIDLPRFETFANSISQTLRARVEYVEDPFPYNPEAWAKANALLPLAIDNEYEKVAWETETGPLPFKVMVIKPARQDVEKAVERATKFGLKMVVTSALDHPVGVAHAAWVAGELKKTHPSALLDCGCLSLRSYRGNEFVSSMIQTGPYLSDVPGKGVGFDILFGKIAWQPLEMFK